MLKIMSVHAFTKGYKWHKNAPVMSKERKREIFRRVLFKLRVIRIFDNRKQSVKLRNSLNEKQDRILNDAQYQPSFTNLLKKH